MVRLAGVAEPALGVDLEAMVGSEQRAEFLWGLAIMGGHLRQPVAQCHNGGLTPRRGGDSDTGWEFRAGRFLTWGGRQGASENSRRHA